MLTKTKIHTNAGIKRIEVGGNIKEIFVKEDVSDPKKRRIDICFMGKQTSGIVQLSSEEAMRLSRTLATLISRLNKKKVI